MISLPLGGETGGDEEMRSDRILQESEVLREQGKVISKYISPDGSS